MTMANSLSIKLTQKADYRFEIDFGAGLETLQADLPPPLGQSDGPSPEHLLAAAVGNCLSASLLFALRKFRQETGHIEAVITCHVDRNEQRQLRVSQLQATLNLGKPAAEFEHLERVLSQFEDFCTVSQSVRQGIPLVITVQDSTGSVLR